LVVYAHDEAGLNAALASEEYRGTVSRGVESVSYEWANLIRQHFPQTANSRVYILKEGVAPWDGLLTLTLLVAGCLIAIGALVLGVMRTLARTDEAETRNQQ
jgi:hypothetical protein